MTNRIAASLIRAVLAFIFHRGLKAKARWRLANRRGKSRSRSGQRNNGHRKRGEATRDSPRGTKKQVLSLRNRRGLFFGVSIRATGDHAMSEPTQWMKHQRPMTVRLGAFEL